MSNAVYGNNLFNLALYRDQLVTMNITKNQYAALLKAREHWGRHWKRQLSTAWETGKYPSGLNDSKSELQELRNAHGPSWLCKFKFNN
jgi:hypothetical protein